MSGPLGAVEEKELDALIVGGGFGGVCQLHKLRKEGFNVKLVDNVSDYGGVWYWNRYPGARVDSTVPHYEFSDPELWNHWLWKQRFPGSQELRDYFSFVADKWDLRKDTQFSTLVTAAQWSDVDCRWHVTTEDSNTRETQKWKVSYLLMNTGFAGKRHIPDWPGIDKFKGFWVHPSFWPHEEPSLKGKKIAVIGTGSTGVQLTQDLAPLASEFVLFQRTPNLALPMKQVDYQGDEQPIPKQKYDALFKSRNENFGGFNFDFLPRGTFDDDEEKRRETYEELWAEGDFHFWLATYYDMLFSPDANKAAYDFWKEKVRARISDPVLKEAFAPETQPHAFGCKRISLENRFYELFNAPNVNLCDLKKTPIVEVTEKGIKTTNKEYEFDLVVCATGFDAITGGLLQIDIRGEGGQRLQDKWKEGVKTYLGMAVSGFPNMFFTYGPQAPTALCNGPTCAELQGDWIVNCMKYMRDNNFVKITADSEAEKKWAASIWTLANASLLPNTKSVSTYLSIYHIARACLCSVD
ncbi:hypothetical protein H2198_009179 [Neophaeococcomyces mojaviensis]|uniref:Uncharacterized protein n=1 Tax=Neophaeococcomyces mojaviensis TaxID=3383035 RepID=A0ACC2ZV81_9EURO|nr:hypothetical protein H2198_009179 [Knufia sp. JES_112]